jgi:N6-L-threonylcarbamoyladenine synthase
MLDFMKKVLAIETSCDDTSLAIVREENGSFFVDKIMAYSQINDHQQYGGVVPEIAFRLHSEQILALLQHFMDDIDTIDAITVTTHPWLAWSLLVWKTVAYMIGEHYKKPVIGAHHIYGHVFSLLLERNIADVQFPWVVLTASWGHNEIYVVEKNTTLNDATEIWTWLSITWLTISKLWKTLDDAAWECFDKVARMLGWPYPWGQWISEKALLWKPNSEYRFKRALLKEHDNPYDFSFSGMKSQSYNLLQKLSKEWVIIEWQILHDIAYEFQEAIVDTLVYKLDLAVKQYMPKTVWIVWWVSANDRLFLVAQEKIGWELWLQVLRPMKKLYSTDNGAMIGVVWLLS